jgi:hypothetical protein
MNSPSDGPVEILTHLQSDSSSDQPIHSICLHNYPFRIASPWELGLCPNPSPVEGEPIWHAVSHRILDEVARLYWKVRFSRVSLTSREKPLGPLRD